MPQEFGEDRLKFRLSSDDAVELDALGEGFAGLARQFRRHLTDSGLDPDQVPAKLFVTNVKSSSIEFELATRSCPGVWCKSFALYAVSGGSGRVAQAAAAGSLMETLSPV